ncbi:MAG: chromosome segregation protein SMC [Deltaproteobacteria bacterium]|nr:chromosome segregation protein SMC [Deltaproteobacteria bacterium]
MRLKQVRLSGFKSFCDDTEFSFEDDGITVIVGPNGCGKSNVVDAVRWALGEQSPKHMRSGAMSDVIFAGSTQRKPVGRAEVTLLFDNSDQSALEKYNEYSEIAITRRLYRSGDSEYLINKMPARLMDIRELLMDTGAAGRSYSIVEQGRVDEFITSSPAERRAYMEEAAGIVRYKVKRISAEKKLEQTRQNLLRVEDILGELDRQEKVLREQTETAREFLALKEEAERLNAALVGRRHSRSEEKCREINAGLENIRLEEAGIQQQLSTLESRMEELSMEQARRELALRESRETLNTKMGEIQAAETGLALAQQERKNASDWNTQLADSLAELKQKKETLAGQLAAQEEEARRLGEMTGEHNQELSRREEQFEKLGEEARTRTAQVQTLHEKLLEAHTQINGLAAQAEMNRERILDSERWREGMQSRLQGTREELEGFSKELAAEETHTARQREELERLEGLLHALTGSTGAKADELAACRGEEQERHKALLACRSRLDTLSQIEADYQGFGESVRGFLGWCGQNPEERDALGIMGPLADMMNVPGEVASWAGDFLAGHLETILIKSAETLPRLAERLAELELGGITVMALDALPPELNAGSQSGSAEKGGPALADLIGFQDQAGQIAAALFGATYVLEAGTPPYPLPGDGLSEWLPRDGAWRLDRHNRMTLGRDSAPAAGILQRRAEIESLTGEEEKLQGQLEKSQAQGQALHEQLEELRQQRLNTEEQRAQTQLKLREIEQNLAGRKREMERLEQSALSQSEELKLAAEELTRLEAQVESLAAEGKKWAETRVRLEGELEEARAEEQEAREKLTAETDRLTEIRVEQQRAQSHLEATQARGKDLADAAAEVNRKLAEADQNMGSQGRRITEAEEKIEALTDTLRKGRDVLDTLRGVEQEHREVFDVGEQQFKKLGGEIKQVRASHEAVMQRIHAAEMALAQEQMRLEQYAEQLAEQNVPQLPPLEEELDEKTLESRVAAAQSRLRRMEGVNLAAPQEYDALMERLGFLGTQQEDLNKAIEDLETSIRRMNNESRRRFRETFDAVNEKFQALFPKVFGGGEARLVLTDSDDPLEAGVDIVAQPPGKKLQSLNLLSGGEKALTAISLIFSFFLHKPSPFCLLDEVDAPLDDMNVTRFNKLIESMTDHSQFIIITHNKRTMEVGDLLYGVTMEEAGVSKVVSVNLSGAA